MYNHAQTSLCNTRKWNLNMNSRKEKSQFVVCIHIYNEIYNRIQIALNISFIINILTRESNPSPRRSMLPPPCTGVCEVGCGGYICCCCMEGPPRSMSRRSPISESTPGMTVAAGGAAGVSAGGEGWSSPTFPLGKKWKKKNDHITIGKTFI